MTESTNYLQLFKLEINIDIEIGVTKFEQYISKCKCLICLKLKDKINKVLDLYIYTNKLFTSLYTIFRVLTFASNQVKEVSIMQRENKQIPQQKGNQDHSLSFKCQNSVNDSYSYFQVEEQSIQKPKTNPYVVRKPDTHQIIYRNVYGYGSNEENMFENMRNREHQIALKGKQQKYNKKAKNQKYWNQSFSQQSFDTEIGGYYKNLYQKNYNYEKSSNQGSTSAKVKDKNYVPMLEDLQLSNLFINQKNSNEQYSKMSESFQKRGQIQSQDSLQISQLNYYETIYKKQIKELQEKQKQKVKQKSAISKKQKQLLSLKVSQNLSFCNEMQTSNNNNNLNNFKNTNSRQLNQSYYHNTNLNQNNLSFVKENNEDQIKKTDKNMFKKKQKVQSVYNKNYSQKQQGLSFQLSMIKDSQKFNQNQKRNAKDKNKFSDSLKISDKLNESDLSLMNFFAQQDKKSRKQYQKCEPPKKVLRGNSYINQRGKIEEIQQSCNKNQSRLQKFKSKVQSQNLSKFQSDIMKQLAKEEKTKQLAKPVDLPQYKETRKKQILTSAEFQGEVDKKQGKIYVQKLKKQKIPRQIMKNLQRFSKTDDIKHHSIYYVYQTSIIIIKQTFNFLTSDILVVPYREIFSKGQSKIEESSLQKYLNRYLPYDIIATLNKNQQKKQLREGSIIKFHAGKIKNLNQLYMLKMSTTNLEDHASKVLGVGVKKIFQLLTEQMLNSQQKEGGPSIIFPAVNYPGLRRQNVGEKLLPQILLNLAQLRHKYKGSILLKQIILCVPKQDEYLSHLSVMNCLMVQYRKVFVF